MIAEALALAASLGAASVTTDIVYRPAQRAVSNWRIEAAINIDADARMRWRFLGFDEPSNLPRCVRLNNYWCVKSARWNGEISTDVDGHVAFSSAHEGAVVAAQLLRRYYVDYGRTSAMAIVTRWAPAECAAARTRPRGRSAGRASGADGLTTRGIRNTARARWLAANRGRVAGGRSAARNPGVRTSRVAARPAPMMRAPEIAVGMGERATSGPPVRMAPVRLASLGLPDSPRDAQPATPRIPCAGEAVRIRNYARAIARGIADDPTADLKLFDETGRPTPALARAMANMAAVEIGPMRASGDLIAGAIADHVEQVREKREEAAVPLPPAAPARQQAQGPLAPP